MRLNRIFAAIAAALMLAGASLAAPLVPLPPHPDGLPWPTEAWPRGDLPAETRDEIKALIAEAMGKTKADIMGETRGLVIIWRGRLVAEEYGKHFTPQTKQVSWSMAKSVTQALAGRAVQLGLIASIDAPMPSPFRAGDPRRDVTWRQWMQAVDGQDYKEIDGDPDPVKNDVSRLMYGGGRGDVLAFIAREFPQVHAPGTYWSYSTPAYHLVGWALQQVTGAVSPAQFSAWADAEFFRQLGMDVQLEYDPKGTFLGGSLVWASPRDFAKFGYLYLRGGVWEGRQVLPAGWVDFARKPGPATNTNVYGAGWWIIPAQGPLSHRQTADSEPRDAFHAGGHEGQTIWVVPSRDLVIVRLGLMDNGGDNWPVLYEWNQRVARAFPQARP